MKKMVLGIVGFIVLSAQVLMAAISVDVLSAFGPDFNTSSYIDAFDANMKVVALGGSSSSNLTPAWYQDVVSGNVNSMVVTDYNYWQGVTDPVGNYSNEHGGRLYFGAVISGDLVNKVSLSKISYSINKDGSVSSGNYSNSAYGTYLVGVDSDGIGGWIYNTGGLGTNSYDKVIIVNSHSYTSLTNAEPFLINATFTYNGSISDTKTVSIIPEPAVAGMVVIGGLLIWIKRRFYARN